MIKVDLRFGAKMLETREVIEKWTGNKSERWIKKEGHRDTKSGGCARQHFPEVEFDWTSGSQKASSA